MAARSAPVRRAVACRFGLFGLVLANLLFHPSCTRDKGCSSNDASTERVGGSGGGRSGTGGGNSGTGGDSSGTGGGSSGNGGGSLGTGGDGSGTGGGSSGTGGGYAGAGGSCEVIGSGCRSDRVCCSGQCGPYGCYEVDASAETNDAGMERTEGTGGSGVGYIACGSPAPLVIGGQDTGFTKCGVTGVLHRTRVVDCPNLLPRAGGGSCTALGTLGVSTDPCVRDSDCTAKPYGYCAGEASKWQPCGCNYGCAHDLDCVPGQLCECADPIGICRAASCTDDTRCDTGSLCASSALSWGGCSWTPPARGFECPKSEATSACRTRSARHPIPRAPFHPRRERDRVIHPSCCARRFRSPVGRVDRSRCPAAIAADH